MGNFDDIVLFGNTSLADVFKQIHRNNKDTDKQIGELIDTLKPIASANAGAATMLMPTVKDLIDVNVKNNEQLIKMAAIAQRASSTSNSSNNVMDFINSDEIQQLLAEQKEIEIQAKQLHNIPQIKQLTNDI
jgi:ABC-type transporter Mla subunit MlaD